MALTKQHSGLTAAQRRPCTRRGAQRGSWTAVRSRAGGVTTSTRMRTGAAGNAGKLTSGTRQCGQGRVEGSQNISETGGHRGVNTRTKPGAGGMRQLERRPHSVGVGGRRAGGRGAGVRACLGEGVIGADHVELAGHRQQLIRRPVVLRLQPHAVHRPCDAGSSARRMRRQQSG